MRVARPKSVTSRAAFTLLELVVAAMMLAVLLASIGTAFYGAHKLRRTNEAALQGQHEIQRALNYLKRDLRSIVLPTTNDTSQIPLGTGVASTNAITLSGPMITGAGGTGAATGSASFEFHTASGIRDSQAPWPDIQRVTYLLRSPMDRFDNSGNELIRVVTRNLLPGVEPDYGEQVLLRGIDQVIFEFWTGDQWLDYWDSMTLDPRVPEAIRTTILMRSTDPTRQPDYIRLVTPVSVQPLTNTVQSVTGGTR